jgi:hypothetical protein
LGAALAALMAPAADAADIKTLDPGMVYSDKIVGSVETPDPGRVESDRIELRLGHDDASDEPGITLQAIHVLKAGVAKADVIERTTSWTAGNFNASNAFWAPIAVADPFFWLDSKNNPIALGSHVSADQKVRRVMRYVGAPVAEPDAPVRDFSEPASHVSLFVEADAPVSSGFFVETDGDGRWRASGDDIVRALMGSRPLPAAAGGVIQLHIFAVKAPEHAIDVTLHPGPAQSGGGQ